jgi:hypothetical protein
MNAAAAVALIWLLAAYLVPQIAAEQVQRRLNSRQVRRKGSRQ